MTLTPCAKICVLDPGSRMCLGCGRTLDEIAGWGGRSDAERLAIMALLPGRLAALASSRQETEPA